MQFDDVIPLRINLEELGISDQSKITRGGVVTIMKSRGFWSDDINKNNMDFVPEFHRELYSENPERRQKYLDSHGSQNF